MSNENEQVASLTDTAEPNNGAADSDKSVYDTVYDLFKQQVSEQAPKKLGAFTADTPFDDIGMDSLEKLSVAMDLEERFALFIPDEDIEGFITIQEVVDYLEAALVEKTVRLEQSTAAETKVETTAETEKTTLNNLQDQ